MAGMTCTVTTDKGNYMLSKVTYDILTDDAAGTATGSSEPMTGFVVGFETNPGSTAPTDNWDFTVTSSGGSGADILGGAGADRDTANSEFGYPQRNTTDTTVVNAPFSGPLTVNVSGAGNAKTLQIILWVLNEKRG